MKQRLPARPDLGHLKKQAKQLLAAYQTQDPGAITRLREALPAAAGSDDAAIAAMGLRLHDAQSCVAREYGFASWADLQGFVAVRRAQADDPQQAIRHWLQCVYAGDIAGDMNRSRPALARRLLEDQPTLARQVAADPWLACAVGDLDVLRAATAQDPTWVHRPGGPLTLPPLVAVAHSSLLRLPAWRERLHACARFLLDAGADVQQSTGSRWPPFPNLPRTCAKAWRRRASPSRPRPPNPPPGPSPRPANSGRAPISSPPPPRPRRASSA